MPLPNSFYTPFTNGHGEDVCTDYDEFCNASEQGRRLAASAMRCNPLARKRVELAYGLDFCRSRYPEVYARLK